MGWTVDWPGAQGSVTVSGDNAWSCTALTPFESEFSEMVSPVWKMDQARMINGLNIPDGFLIDIRGSDQEFDRNSDTPSWEVYCERIKVGPYIQLRLTRI